MAGNVPDTTGSPADIDETLEALWDRIQAQRETPIVKLRKIAAQFRHRTDVKYVDSAVTLVNTSATIASTAANVTYMKDANTRFVSLDAKLGPLSYWGDTANAPRSNQMTGIIAQHQNGFSIDTIASAKVGSTGKISIMIFSGDVNAETRVEVEGQPISDFAPMGFTGVGYININVAPNTQGKQIKVYIPSSSAVFGAYYDAGVSLVAPDPVARINMALVSDSYGQNMAYPNSPDGTVQPSAQSAALTMRLGQEMGAAVFNMSQGGTGLQYPGTGSTGPGTFGTNNCSEYASDDRVNKLVEVHAWRKLDAIIINGSVNDAGRSYTLAGHKAKAKAYFAKLNTNLPGVPLIVIGCESLITFGNSDVAVINQAVREAALEAPNVAVFIDAYTDQWFTGADPATGNVGSVGNWSGVGNADILLSTDGVHPSQYGFKMVARRIVKAIIRAVIK